MSLPDVAPELASPSSGPAIADEAAPALHTVTDESQEAATDVVETLCVPTSTSAYSLSAPPPVSAIPTPATSATIDDHRAQQISTLSARNAELSALIANTEAQLAAIKSELRNPAAETVKTHIALLHQYNEIRDVGQGLIGLIAESRGVRVGELWGEFGVKGGD